MDQNHGGTYGTLCAVAGCHCPEGEIKNIKCSLNNFHANYLRVFDLFNTKTISQRSNV